MLVVRKPEDNANTDRFLFSIGEEKKESSEQINNGGNGLACNHCYKSIK
jgi:hypothetical protein